MASKHIWAYQNDIVTTVSGRNENFLVDSPTGSGKTLMIAAITALILYAKRILIATTQQHIEDAFTKRDYDSIVRVDGSVLAVPPELIQAARTKNGSVRAVRTYLNVAEKPDYALACTHKTLTCLRPLTDLPEDCSNCVLFVDEGHHGPAMGLGQFIDMFVKRGGQLLYFTATSSRDDNDPVLRDDMVLIRRPLAQHMEEGFAPSNLETKIHAIRAKDVTEGQFFGEETPEEAVQKMLVAYMIQAWEEDGRPKTIVRVPPIRGGTSGMIDRIVAAFSGAGARVLDISGQESADKKRFLTELPKERQLADYNDSKYDVLVGIQRTNEGLDWPLCSTVYCVGLPRSILLVTQLLGRATRLKLQANYPESHKDRMRISFFVPCGDEKTREGMLDYHKRYTLLVIAYLANVRAGAEWSLVRDLGRGLVLPLGATDAAAATQTVLQAWPHIDNTLRAEATAKLAAAVADLHAQGSTAPDVQVLDWIWEHYPDTNRPVVRQVAAEIIAQTTGEARERVLSRLLSSVKKALKVGTPVRIAFREAFNTILNDLDSYALVQAQILTDLTEQLIAVTGTSMRAIAAKLGQARPLTPEWLGRVILEHHKRTGVWPKATTKGSVPGWPEESWVEINKSIAARQRNWPLSGIFGLNDFVQVYVRRGTLGQLLNQFCLEVRLDAAECAFVTHLSKQRVRIRGQNVMFHELPVPAAVNVEWPKNYWWVVRWWFEDLRTQTEIHPFAGLYAAVVAENLRRWLVNKGHPAEPPFVDEAACDAMSAEWRNVWVRYQVPEPGYRVENPTVVLEPPAFGRAKVMRWPLSNQPVQTMQRLDGIVRTSPRAGMYYDAAMHVRIHSANELPLDNGFSGVDVTSVAPVAMPLSWLIATVVGVDADLLSAPTDWTKALRQLPARAYTHSGAAEPV